MWIWSVELEEIFDPGGGGSSLRRAVFSLPANDIA